MNIFRLLGQSPCRTRLNGLVLLLTSSTIVADISHLLSIFILLQKMRASSVRFPRSRLLCARAPLDNDSLTQVPGQSCSGISFKSQALYFFVYVTRYLGKESCHFTSRRILPADPQHRSLLVLHGLGLEHYFQAHLSIFLRIHPVPYAQ